MLNRERHEPTDEEILKAYQQMQDMIPEIEKHWQEEDIKQEARMEIRKVRGLQGNLEWRFMRRFGRDASSSSDLNSSG